MLAANTYRLLARKLPRYEQATPYRLWRHFLDNAGKITVADDRVRVDLAVRTYTPVLIDAGYPEIDLPSRGGQDASSASASRSAETKNLSPTS